MDKSITFLGTSHGESSRTRFCSSALYQFGKSSILVDAGEPASALLIRMGYKPEEIGVVLITHFHGDHVNGLVQVTYQMARYSAEGFRPAVYLPEAVDIDALMAWKKATHAMQYEGKVDYRVFPPEGEALYIRDNRIVSECTPDTIKVTSRNTRHLWRANARSQAFFVEADGLRILHTGDLTEELDDLPLKPGDDPVDLCICEGTHFYWAPDRQHPFDVLKNAPIRRLIFNHIGPYWTDGKEYELRELAQQLPYPVDIAFDGMKVIL